MADILINDLRPRIQYVQGGGDNAVSQFDFPFPVLSETDLRVAIGTTILDSADFTTSGIGQELGGTVYLLHVPPEGS